MSAIAETKTVRARGTTIVASSSTQKAAVMLVTGIAAVTLSYLMSATIKSPAAAGRMVGYSVEVAEVVVDYSNVEKTVTLAARILRTAY